MCALNPLRIFPARLIYPKVQADSRWIAINAIDRRSFILHGKDDVPKILAEFALGIKKSKETLQLLDKLNFVNLWNTDYNKECYLDWYRQLCYNYPFVDYSEPDSLNRDALLMTSYSKKAPPPLPITTRAGEIVTLGKSEIFHSTKVDSISEEFIAGLLQVCQGVKEMAPSLSGCPIRKTSPSGGARHPTEIGIIIPQDTTGLAYLKGSWWYLPDKHCLARFEFPHYLENQLPQNSIALVVRSHVERAMWRYRDARSFRPVIIDAGHIVETLDIILQSTGWCTEWLDSPTWSEGKNPFIEPEFGILIATPNESKISVQTNFQKENKEKNPQWITNPCISLIPTSDGLHAETYYPTMNRIKLSPNQTKVLTYCMPSTRGDRPSTTDDLINNLQSSSLEIQALIKSNALLTNSQGWNTWTSAGLWSRYDWYLSLIAHSYSTTQKELTLKTKKSNWVPTNIGKALDKRYTCRKFTGLSIPDIVWKRIFEVLSKDFPAKVIVSIIKSSESISSGNWVFKSNNKFERVGEPLSDSSIAKIAIGQPWTKGLSVVMWLFPDEGSKSWEHKILNLGRVAQRISVAVADYPQIGIFQTPAIVDSTLANLLNLPSSIDEVYMIGIGITKDKITSASNLNFRPSEIIKI